MKIKLIAATVAAAATLVVTSNTAMGQNRNQPQFICREAFDRVTNQRIPTTYAWTERGKSAIIRWTTTLGARGEWTPQRRCQEVSPRFQTAYENGSLQYLTNGMMNGQRVICTAKEERGDCEDLLLTLRPEDNAMAVLRQFNDVLRGRAGATIRQSTGEDQVYIQVDIERFLRTAPVE
jgi:hypothetical protein